MSYKTELHCHNSEFSGCSHVCGADVAKKYIENGYTTLVITNHFFKGSHGIEDHAELCRKMFEAAEVVRDAAGDKLNVLTGMEVCFCGEPNDYLVYGMDEEMAVNMPDMFDMGIQKFHEAIKGTGVIVIQAHPFRFNLRVTNPAFVDGVEVFNGHPGQHSHNYAALTWGLTWAEHHGINERFILTSGTDHHDDWHKPVGGIETEEPISTNEQLVSVLKSGRYCRLSASLGEADY